MVRRAIIRNWMSKNVWSRPNGTGEDPESYRTNTLPVRIVLTKGVHDIY